jgi:hypothetical protein
MLEKPHSQHHGALDSPEYPSPESSAVKRVVPRCVRFDHGIEHGRQLAHAGDQYDLGRLARGDQALVERLDVGVSPCVRLLVVPIGTDNSWGRR